LRGAGLAVVERELPEPFTRLGPAQALIHRREAATVLGHLRRDHPGDVSVEFIAMIDEGAAESEEAYRAARALQEQCKAMLGEVFAGVDMLLVPGAPGAAPKGLAATGNPAFQRIWTAIGAPCLGFPASWNEAGLPLGLQVIAAPGTDRQLLANAHHVMALAALREN
jgi:Asp-tRNA(Asn)/Glu-tRNA(Gln) amidotransferase A subunit family amidase